ncbi:MAG: capsule assembly Wzi family protein [Catalinimonas sp.]
MKRRMLWLLALMLCAAARAQSPDDAPLGTYLPLDPDYYHLLDRYDVRMRRAPGGEEATWFHTSMRPFLRWGVGRAADHLAADSTYPDALSRADRFNVDFLRADNHYWSTVDATSRRPLLGVLYRQRPDFYHYAGKHFAVHLNPVIEARVGRDADQSATLYTNTRGAELHGLIDGKIGFYSYLTENQAVFPAHVGAFEERTRALPAEAFWKRLEPTGYDWITARGYVTFPFSRHVSAQLGHDRFFVGDGRRSMILSDFGPNYFFLKLDTRVWRLHYTNLFAEMKADIISNSLGAPAGSQNYPRKYFAFHHLSLNITPSFNLGLFESVVLGGPDSSANARLEWQYFNPVIFYRAVDQQLGSPDNVIIGLDARWTLFRRVKLYGQFVIDEFLFSRVFDGSGWWGNKQAGQAGALWVDVLGVPNLDLRGEFNIARPYTYGHIDRYTAYAHYNQPLAHPLGANFREGLFELRFQPLPRLTLQAQLIRATYGVDTAGSHWGGDVLIGYDTREQELGNEIGQGVRSRLVRADLLAGYQLRHRLFLEARLTRREVTRAVSALDRSTTIVSGALRWNVAARRHEF